MLGILLSGCGGRLARAVMEFIDTQDDVEIAAGIDPREPDMPFPVYPSAAEVKERPDVIIDCSVPQALPGLLEYALRERVPCVLATTGYGEAEAQMLAGAEKRIPVFASGNMSLGINLLKELAKQAARVLGGSFDIEIVEKHHNQKIDAPSGTAYILAGAVNEGLEAASPRDYQFNRQPLREKRGKNEIGMHAIRGGTITGEHTVLFAGFDEVIELSHIAYSKKIFAAGCVNAARYIHGRPAGRYGMEDLVGTCGVRD
ncbi:MAG: 4-hydroxy-tetrahydrodipicolinate reductase [Oscillospiraceae bacterium]|nr:4-hydroxy-tetrahydrodipicolinate reductase [Oscillospiraceae bacterium]